MESKRNSMNPKTKEEHEDSRTTSHYQPDMNSLKKEIKQKNRDEGQCMEDL
jgi:hypothetical protein